MRRETKQTSVYKIQSNELIIKKRKRHLFLFDVLKQFEESDLCVTSLYFSYATSKIRFHYSEQKRTIYLLSGLYFSAFRSQNYLIEYRKVKWAVFSAFRSENYLIEYRKVKWAVNSTYVFIVLNQPHTRWVSSLHNSVR